MKLDNEEKDRIRNAYSGGSWDDAFNTIEDILTKHLASRTTFTIEYIKAERQQKTGGQQRDYWNEIDTKAYEVFLTLPEKVKQGRHLAEFKQAVRDTVALGETGYKKKYEAFVKRYKEENTPEAKQLRELDDSLIQLAFETEPPLG